MRSLCWPGRWLFTGCGNCRGAAITFDSEATWFGWKLGAAGFKTVFWIDCSMNCMVIGETLLECTPVIGLIHWLDCRQSFSKTILSVLLGRCEVLFAAVGKQGIFYRSQNLTIGVSICSYVNLRRSKILLQIGKIMILRISVGKWILIVSLLCSDLSLN